LAWVQAGLNLGGGKTTFLPEPHIDPWGNLIPPWSNGWTGNSNIILEKPYPKNTSTNRLLPAPGQSNDFL
jgi:hypothetical protein